MANLTDADKVLRNDTGKDIVTQLTAIKTAIENGGGGSGASTVSQLTDVLLSADIPDGDVLVRDNNLTGGKLWKNATITVELTQAEYNQLVADDDVLPDVNYYITDAPSMQGTSADLSYDGTTKSTYTKIEEIDTELSGKADSSTTYTKTEVDNKFSLTSGTVTASSNVTIARYTLKKFGNVCFLSVVLYVSVAHSSGAKLAKLSITPTQQVDMIAASKTNEQGVAWYVDTDGYLYTNDAMVTGQTYYCNAWYI